ncbi:Swiss army Knife RNA repair protein HAD [Gracilaria domingensis]|nr:Swiss army Knife RNA repair protein HAD [Gracilaria domingensis]
MRKARSQDARRTTNQSGMQRTGTWLRKGSIAMDLPPRLARALKLHKKAGPIHSLHVFDFDGTLVRTPGPEEGKRRYVLETGKAWTGGWWGRPGSLLPPVVDSPFPPSRVVRTVFEQMEEVITRSETAVGVIVTGRIQPVREPVLRILDEICIAAKNDTVAPGESFLDHEAVITHPGGRRTTLQFKEDLFRQLVTEEPLGSCPLKELHIWEDRKMHAEAFATDLNDELMRLKAIKTTVHLVTPETP